MRFSYEVVWDSIQVDGQTFKATINNLTEGFSYRIRVAGVTQEGVGVYSSYLTAAPVLCEAELQ